MTLDDNDIAVMRRNGAKITGHKPATVDEGSYYLRTILEKLTALLERKSPDIIVKPPDIIVKPPEVNVTAPPLPIPARKWKFEITKDQNGRTKEIVATAMDK